MSSRGAQQALVPGRMVISLNQRSGLPELGVVCGNVSAMPGGPPLSGFGGKSSGFGSLQPSSASASAAAPAGEGAVTQKQQQTVGLTMASQNLILSYASHPRIGSKEV